MYTPLTVLLFLIVAIFAPIHGEGHGHTAELINEAYEALHGHHSRRSLHLA